MYKAARVSDKTLHLPKIVTGSPDTTTCKKAQARLGDLTDICKVPPIPPAPPCQPPLGRIVSASRTVFVNRLGAARVTDFVWCGAASVIGTEPPGCSHPPASTYSVRSQDHYEKLMEVEHEASAFDETDAYQREAFDGQRQAPSIPVGVPPGGGASAARKPGETKPGPRKKGGGKPHRTKADRNNPVGGKKKASPAARRPAGELPAAETEVRMGQGPGGQALGPPTDRGDGLKPEEETEEARQKKTIALEFPLDLAFGMRLALPLPPIPATNAIVTGCNSVFIG